MEFKIGKVISFDNYVGEIKEENTKYIFLDIDLKDIIKVNDTVSFNGETINNINKAFFIEKYPKENKKY